MWTKHIQYLIELAAAGGLIYFLSFVSWSKMTLGAVLTVVGAFFPYSSSDKAKGDGTLQAFQARVLLRGSLRVGVVIAGIALIIMEGRSGQERANTYRTNAEISANAVTEITLELQSKPEDGTNPTLIKKLLETQDRLKRQQSLKYDKRTSDVIAAIDELIVSGGRSPDKPKIEYPVRLPAKYGQTPDSKGEVIRELE